MAELMAGRDIELLGLRGLRISPGLPREDWRAGFRELMSLEDGINFFIGDMLLHSERHYGDKYTWALQECMLKEQTLTNIVSVCRRIPPERRLGGKVSFSHHEAVASLKPEDQDKWLREAQEKGLTVTDLRTALRTSGAKPRGNLPPPVGFVYEAGLTEFTRYLNKELLPMVQGRTLEPAARPKLKASLTGIIKRLDQICDSL